MLTTRKVPGKLGKMSGKGAVPRSRRERGRDTKGGWIRYKITTRAEQELDSSERNENNLASLDWKGADLLPNCCRWRAVTVWRPENLGTDRRELSSRQALVITRLQLRVLRCRN